MGDNTNTNGEALEELVIDIPENLELTLHPEICIYRVRSPIRKINEAAYTPQLVSIGPFHHNKPELQNMEIQKLRYLKLFCQRVRDDMTEKQVVNHLSRIIKDCEEQIRRCYEEPCKLSSSELVKMILLDAIFIIELSLRDNKSEEYKDDFLIGQPSMLHVIRTDFVLIENQLPYFIIKRLYDETVATNCNDFDRLFCFFFGVCLPKETAHYLEGLKHFTDLMRYGFLNTSHLKLEYGGIPNCKLKYSASKLHEAGVKFEAVKHDCDLMLDVEFVNGVLKIPVIQVHDFSELLFRNVMELEQRYYPRHRYVCNYFFLLGHLLNSGEDVDLLVDAGIVLHWYGNNKLFANFISKLCQGIGDYKTCYDSLYKKLNEHYENKWNRRKATLGLVYFSNLWRGTGTIVATILLLLTLMQAITSIKSL